MNILNRMGSVENKDPSFAVKTRSVKSRSFFQPGNWDVSAFGLGHEEMPLLPLPGSIPPGEKFFQEFQQRSVCWRCHYGAVSGHFETDPAPTSPSRTEPKLKFFKELGRRWRDR